MEPTPSVYRYRINYAKLEAIRYIGNLDLHHAWERSLRRAQVTLAYSHGFHPQPRIQQACALPLGFTSQCEVLDIWLEQQYPIDYLCQTIALSIPPGLEISSIEEIDLKSPPLQTQVISTLYRVTLLDPANLLEIETRVQDLIRSTSLVRERRGKTYDLRPLIESLSCQSEELEQDSVILFMRLSAREGATGRPEEVLESLGLDSLATRVHRLEMYFAVPSA